MVGRPLSWVLAAALATAPAAAGARPPAPSPSPEASASLRDADTPDALLKVGNRAMANGDYDLAIAAYRRVIALNNDVARVAAARRWIANALLKKSEELLQRGQPDAALLLLDQLLAESPPPELARLAERRRAEVLGQRRPSASPRPPAPRRP